MEQFPEQAAPPEVEAVVASLGFPAIKTCSRIKVSFHTTYIMEFEGPVPSEEETPTATSNKAILQLLGSQLGDKPLFRFDRPISTAVMVKAAALAGEAGVRTPKVYATGMVEEWGPLKDVPFILQEMIETRTVEDEVMAPRSEFRRIVEDIRGKFAALPLAGVDTEPIPRFEDVFAHVAYLKDVADKAEAPELVEALVRWESEARAAGIETVPPILVHQDLNGGNTLCSPDPANEGAWKLDALIDWEGAAIADPRIIFEHAEPWITLRRLAEVAKIRRLEVLALEGRAPRCVGEELAENYGEMSQELVEVGWLASVRPLKIGA